MIRHLDHHAVQRFAWDEHLMRCANRLWYIQRWVLDAASPGWEALVDEERGALMPLTWRSRLGFDYLFQPYAIQQLGVFARDHDAALDQAFIDAVPERFRYWDIHVNEAMQELRFDTMGRSTQQKISLLGDIERQRAAYSQGHRRNLRKAEAHRARLSWAIDPDGFMALFQRTTAMRFGKTKERDLDVLRALVQGIIMRGQGRILGLLDGGELLAAVVFVEWEGRSILLKSAVDERAREMSALFLIVDEYMASGAGGSQVLDLAGSNTPSVARFNAGFGASASVYLRLIRNRLPQPLRWYKQRRDGI
jgi:hypothetical protein